MKYIKKITCCVRSQAHSVITSLWTDRSTTGDGQTLLSNRERILRKAGRPSSVTGVVLTSGKRHRTVDVLDPVVVVLKMGLL